MGLLPKKKHNTMYYSSYEISESRNMGAQIYEMSQSILLPKKEAVILCIGTDRATGDTLGPMVGSLLSQNKCNYKIYGTLKSPVHALNIKDYISLIYTSHNDPFVIAIDASLGKCSDIGKITLSKSPLHPGIGVNKKLPAVGDLSITGIVNMSGKQGLNMLQSTRLYTVCNMAMFIAGAILYSDTLRYE